MAKNATKNFTINELILPKRPNPIASAIFTLFGVAFCCWTLIGIACAILEAFDIKERGAMLDYFVFPAIIIISSTMTFFSYKKATNKAVNFLNFNQKYQEMIKKIDEFKGV